MAGGVGQALRDAGSNRKKQQNAVMVRKPNQKSNEEDEQLMLMADLANINGDINNQGEGTNSNAQMGTAN